jgi:hypothetical protein
MSEFAEYLDSTKVDGKAAATEPQPPPAPEPKRAGTKVPRVAVVGVHGVGKHSPNATEDALSDLLLSLPVESSDGPRLFNSFRAVGIQVPLQRLDVERIQPRPKRRFLGLYEESSANFAEYGAAYAKTNQVLRGQTGDGFTRVLLQDYEGGADGDAYITTRLEGRRNATAKEGEADVHVYEVLWADLAGSKSTFVSFFLALFQLLLHLGSLSRLAVDTGAAENPSGLWRAYVRMQRYAVRMLQIFIPLFKVILLIVIFSCIPSLYEKTHDNILVPVALGAIGGVVLGFILSLPGKRPIRMSPWIWALRVMLPGIVGALIGLGVPHLGSHAPHLLAIDKTGALECWIVLGIPLLYFILSNYEEVRKGVEKTGWFAYGLFFLIFFYYLLPSSHTSVSQATFWTAEWVLASVRASWLLLFAFAFLALVLGSLAWRSQKDEAKRARARAAVRTSRFALALPTVLFLLITSMLWAAMFAIAKMVKKPFFDVGVRHLPPGGSWLLSLHLIPKPETVAVCDDYFRGALAWSVGYQLPITLGLFGLGAFLLIWWALPAALTEKFPLRNKKEPPRDSTNEKSVRLGTWLSRGLDATSVVTFLFWSSIFLAPPIFYLAPQLWQAPWTTLTIAIVSAAALAGSGAVMALVVKEGSPVLGVVLDVDNYLRTEPKDATPRAKIFERYVSTLRYLASYRDEDGRGYDSVVIVAHSLGALISTDLLRFLYVHGDPALRCFGLAGDQVPGEVPIRLMTMGNPIRQLLNRFFSYLYDWVRDEPDNGLRPLPAPQSQVPPATIAADALPDPAELGVTMWVNAYRSGDYVGRSMWLEEWYYRTNAGSGEQPKTVRAYETTSGLRTEMCIGAGAHTHYWDDTAPDVAVALNKLIY